MHEWKFARVAERIEEENSAQSSKPQKRKLESYLSKANKQNNVKIDKGETFMKTRKRNEKYQKRKTWKRNKQEVPKNEHKEKK